MTMMTFENISARFGEKTVLDGVSFSLSPGRITALIGRNGCGKSTLLGCVNRQVRYDGRISFQDRDIAGLSPRERASLWAILPQTPGRTIMTVEELAAMGRTPYREMGRRPSPHDREKTEEALRLIGLSPLRKRPVNRLSGGERQRAYLAMVLAQDTQLILLDEPTTYMDMSCEADFLRLLTGLRDQCGKTLMVVMHNLTQAVAFADDIVVLDGGKACFCGSAHDCVQSGIIERVFQVRRCDYVSEGRSGVFYQG